MEFEVEWEGGVAGGMIREVGGERWRREDRGWK
jgi:hypothetical protein